MAKDKITLETISGQLTGVSSELSNQWNALNTLAGRLGISLTDTGEYFMESDNSDIPQLSQQTSGGDVPSQPPAPAMDVTTIAKEVVAEFKKDPPPVDLGKQSVSLDIMSIVKANKGLFDVVTKPWNDWFINHRKSLLKLHGYKEVSVGNDVVLMIDDNPEIPPNPFKENCPNEPTPKPTEKPQSGSAFWRVAYVIITSRPLGYFIALIAILFALHEHQQCQQLEDDAKRYKIYRTLYQSIPEDRKVYEYFDSEIEKHGTDKVLKHVQERDREIQRQQFRGKKK